MSAPLATLGPQAPSPSWLRRCFSFRPLPRLALPPHPRLPPCLAWLPLPRIPPPLPPPCPLPPHLAPPGRALPRPPPHLGAALAHSISLGSLPRPADASPLTPLPGLPLHLCISMAGSCGGSKRLLSHSLAFTGPQGAEPWIYGGAFPAGEIQLHTRFVFIQNFFPGRERWEAEHLEKQPRTVTANHLLIDCDCKPKMKYSTLLSYVHCGFDLVIFLCEKLHQTGLIGGF